jgi:hypothetical protein
MISETLKLELFRARSRGARQYQLALAANLNPSTFSQMLHGCIRVAPGDLRIVNLGAALGLRPDQCFESEESEKVCV